jgi:hypothetical protein
MPYREIMIITRPNGGIKKREILGPLGGGGGGGRLERQSCGRTPKY